MTYDELVQAARLRARKTKANALDEDIKTYIDFVLSDLQRVGVPESRLQEPDDPIIINAILTYVRAFYPLDSNHDRWMAAYDRIMVKVKDKVRKWKTAETGT